MRLKLSYLNIGKPKVNGNSRAFDIPDFKTLHGWIVPTRAAAVTGTCIFSDATTFINKDCSVLFGDISIVPLFGPALGYLTAMCSPGWRNLVPLDWNDLLVGREFDGKFFKNVKSPPHAKPLRPPPPPPAGLTLIGALALSVLIEFNHIIWFFYQS